MRHLFFLLTFFSVCASAQAENLCGHKEKRNLSSRQGVNGMGTESFTYDEAAKALTANAFTRTGYTFAGWATSAEGAVIYADQAEVQNLTATANGIFDLYAKWTENVATLTEANPIAPLTAWSGQQTKVTFTRSGLTAGAYSTICLPYNFTASETCTFYKFDGVKKVGDDWVADISTTTGGGAFLCSKI